MSAIARLSACPRLTLAACRVVRPAPQALLSTSAARLDIDSAAKFIGAGAATVGVAGSGAGIGSGKCYTLLGSLNGFVVFLWPR
jgi:F-type H+-transporting ATPase subunit c